MFIFLKKIIVPFNQKICYNNFINPQEQTKKGVVLTLLFHYFKNSSTSRIKSCKIKIMKNFIHFLATRTPPFFRRCFIISRFLNFFNYFLKNQKSHIYKLNIHILLKKIYLIIPFFFKYSFATSSTLFPFTPTS